MEKNKGAGLGPLHLLVRKALAFKSTRLAIHPGPPVKGLHTLLPLVAAGTPPVDINRGAATLLWMTWGQSKQDWDTDKLEVLEASIRATLPSKAIVRNQEVIL